MKTELTGRSLVGRSRGMGAGEVQYGVWVAKGEVLAPGYVAATEEEVGRAVELAEMAFVDAKWRDAACRAEFLRAIAYEIEMVVDDLVERGTQETALPEVRIRGEAGRTVAQLKMFADLLDEGEWVDARVVGALPDRQPLPRPELRSMYRPLGPVAVFCASNFPLAFSVAGGDTASAFAAGCPVVVVAHSSHPGVAEIVGVAVAKAVMKCGLPEGVFSLLYGGGRKVGAALVRHPKIQAVGFTGSRAGGTSLMKVAAERDQPIPVYAEMSSVNPVLILPSALEEGSAEKLAEAFYASLTLGVGQFCTNPGLILLPREGTECFYRRLRELVVQGTPGFMLNETIANAYGDAVESFVSTAGVEVLCRSSQLGGRGQGAPILLRTTADHFVKKKGLQGEIFGPGALLVEGNEEELLEAIEVLEGQLTASVHGSEAELTREPRWLIALERKAGRLVFNGFPTGVEVCAAMIHGGPYPATSDGRSTSVGTMAILRFLRGVCYQSFPTSLLPKELQKI